jgi:hypothetical protein
MIHTRQGIVVKITTKAEWCRTDSGSQFMLTRTRGAGESDYVSKGTPTVSDDMAYDPHAHVRGIKRTQFTIELACEP